ncbi:MAG: hypothetical protein HY925_07335 [Elusimicrobia bacterium]|nr:hypothetical protein [Elusimicrobiota bacterium]
MTHDITGAPLPEGARGNDLVADLVARAKDGDDRAWGALVARYAPVGATSAGAQSPEVSITHAGHPATGAGAAGGSPPAAGGAGSAGKEAHGVGAMGKIADAKSDAMEKFLALYPWLAPLGVARLHTIEGDVPVHGLWGACFAHGLYPDCRQACASDPKGNCVALDAWKSCLDWRGDQNTCVSACHHAKAYCTVPAAIEDSDCKPKMTCGTLGNSACPAPPPFSYCDPAWPGGAPPAPTPSPTPTPGGTPPSGLYNIVAPDAATCQNAVRDRWALNITCTLGGGCGVDCGKPGPSCPSANPAGYGFCLDPADPSLPPQTYNFVVAGSVADCNNAIKTSGLGVNATCSIGGGCGVSCGMPGPGCPSANPSLPGACFQGPAIPPWAR